MSKVFVITRGNSDSGIICIFSTKEKAAAYVEAHKPEEFYIEEWELDEETTPGVAE